MMSSERHWIKSFCQSIAALLAASSVSTLAFITGHTSDPTTTQIVNSPSVIERWESVADDSNARKPSNPESPLVQQARRFALLLNPPRPIVTSETTTTQRGVAKHAAPKPPEVRPSGTRPKFTLIATSLYPANASESMALISEPGQKTRWIKAGTQLGYLVVEQILPGAIVYRDGIAQHRLEIGAGEALAERRIETGPPAGPKQSKRYARSVAKATSAMALDAGRRPGAPSLRKRPKFHRLGPVR